MGKFYLQLYEFETEEYWMGLGVLVLVAYTILAIIGSTVCHGDLCLSPIPLCPDEVLLLLPSIRSSSPVFLRMFVVQLVWRTSRLML